MGIVRVAGRIENVEARPPDLEQVAVGDPHRDHVDIALLAHDGGLLTKLASRYPGDNSIMTRDKATIGKILKDHSDWPFGKDQDPPTYQERY